MDYFKFILLFCRFYTADLIDWGAKHTKNPQYYTCLILLTIFTLIGFNFLTFILSFPAINPYFKIGKLQYVTFLTLISYYFVILGLAEYSVSILMNFGRNSKVCRNTISTMNLQ